MPRRPRSRRLGRLARPLISLGLLAAGLLMAGAFVGIAAQGNAVARDAERLRREIVAEQQRLAENEAEVQRRMSEDYVVEAARDYGYVRPGEGLIAVEQGKKASTSTDGRISIDPGRVARWIALFFGAR